MNGNRYIEDWLSARTESESTVRSYKGQIRIFSQFAKDRGLVFDGIVEAWRQVKRAGIDERETFLESWSDVVRSFHTKIKKKYAPLSVKNLLATVKSFLGFWEIPVSVRLPRRACVIYHNKDLTPEEVRQILTFASPRDRVIWLVMTEAGMRAHTCVNLKYWQIKDDFEADRVPMRILLPSASLKDHVGDRWTFIGEDGFRELQQYLAQRLPLEPDEYVFESERPRRVRGDQFSVASLSVKFSRVVLKIGLDKKTGKPKAIRMHGLRKYFRNSMRADSGFKKFWMGHSLGVDAHYVSRDPERHRQEYREGYKFLRVFQPSVVSLVEVSEKLREKDEEIKRLQNQVELLKAEKLSQEDVEKLQRILKLLEEGKIIVRTKP